VKESPVEAGMSDFESRPASQWKSGISRVLWLRMLDGKYASSVRLKVACCWMRFKTGFESMARC